MIWKFEFKNVIPYQLIQKMKFRRWNGCVIKYISNMVQPFQMHWSDPFTRDSKNVLLKYKSFFDF